MMRYILLLLCATTLAYAQPFSVVVPCGTAAECSALMERLTATEPAPEPEPPTDPDPEPEPEPPPVVSDSDLFGDAYADMRREFLALEPGYTLELRPGEGTVQAAADDYGIVPYWGQPHRQRAYGYQHGCRNSMGVDSYCMTIVRSAARLADWPCGRDPVPPETYATCPECACTEPLTPAYATWWVNATNNHTLLGPLLQMDDPRVHGADVRNGPLNRLCAEVEVDPQPFATDKSEARSADTLVNPEDTHSSLRSLQVGMGTYTSPAHGESYVPDEEVGSTIQGGGSHWYHQWSGYDTRPTQRTYAVTPTVFLGCINDAPIAVRSGSGWPYFSNPLATVVGDREDGQIDALSYIAHITRLYQMLSLSQAVHPYTVRLSRLVLAYERDDVRLLSGRGSMMSVAMSSGGPVVFPVTLYNWAPEPRTYDVTLMAWGHLPRRGDYPPFRVWWDRDASGTVTAGDTQLLGEAQITIPADTDVPLLAVLEPSWQWERYGRRVTQVHLRLQEVDRLRGTSHTFRIWEGTAEDVANQDQILPTLVYPSETSPYKTQAQWNQDKPGNMRLERNTPDYRRALERMQ